MQNWIVFVTFLLRSIFILLLNTRAFVKLVRTEQVNPIWRNIMKITNRFSVVKKALSLLIVMVLLVGVALPASGSKNAVYAMPDTAEGKTLSPISLVESEMTPVCQLDKAEDANVIELKPGTPIFTRVAEQIENTPEFTAMGNLAAEQNAQMELLAINALEETSHAVVTYRVAGEVDGFVTNFWIDYEANELLAVQQYFAEQVAEDIVNFRIVINDKEILNVDINSDHNIIMSDGTEMYYADYIKQLDTEAPISTFSFCHWAMAALCGAGGGAACYGLCGIAAIVNVLGGLGCAVACGLIASLGCAGATCVVCGC
jgi:hypothetical protein